MLSDASKLLNDIIKDNDASFIYEKAGSFYKYFMIDEFQDTSELQWNNFIPLIINGLSEGNYSLLVGDVKQSIYRWRNGDWKILASRIYSDLSNFSVETLSLDSNYRSLKNVIEFNNMIFKNASGVLSNLFTNKFEEENIDQKFFTDISAQIKNAYNDVEQKIGKKSQKEGFIEINFITNDEHEDVILNQLPSQFERLQQAGYSIKDIAVLVRKAKEGEKVANVLYEYKMLHPESQYKYDVVSNQSLYIKKNPAVQLLINILYYITSPNNDIIKYNLIQEYYYISNKSESDLITDWQSVSSKQNSLSDFMPKGFENLTQNYGDFTLTQFFEACLMLFKVLNHKDYSAYILSFQDYAQKIISKGVSDIHSFLNDWELDKDSISISLPDEIDAAQIITIHKSKGLQFKVVILPFVNWGLEGLPHNNIIWCSPNQSPFNELDLVPVNYNKKLSKTIFAKDYYLELFHNYIDNLNLLYVALTRAEDGLIVFSNIKENFSSNNYPIEKISHVGELMLYTLENNSEIAKEIISIESGIQYTKGKLLSAETKIEDNTIFPIKYSINNSSQRIKMVLHSDQYFSRQLGDDYNLQYGKAMHQLLAQIEKIDDINEVLNNYLLEGVLSQARKEDVKIHLNKILSNKKVASWFDGSHTIKNEIPILLKNGHIRRPDRVMIKDNKAIVVDYKFGHEEIAHQTQVNEYVDLLSNMGYKKVEGYLWYVFQNKIIPV